MEHTGVQGDHWGLSEDARDLYVRITGSGMPGPGDEKALAELQVWRLVDFDHEAAPGVPVALDPREATRRRMLDELTYLQGHAERVTGLPSLGDELGLHFDRSRWQSGTSEYLAEPALVNARINQIVGQARLEILAAQPNGPRTRGTLDIALERDSLAADRGVRMRTLYRDNVRDDAVTREWAMTMSAKGVQFRTLVAPFERCVIVDRRHAFIADHVTEGGQEYAAWHVQDRATVAWIAAVYEAEWRRAEVWHGELRTAACGAVTRTTRRQREILRDIASGITEQRTAQRLGISKRTLTNEIGVMRDLWGVSTRAELAYRWALSPDRLIDDQPAADAA